VRYAFASGAPDRDLELSINYVFASSTLRRECPVSERSAPLATAEAERVLRHEEVMTWRSPTICLGIRLGCVAYSTLSCRAEEVPNTSRRLLGKLERSNEP